MAVVFICHNILTRLMTHEILKERKEIVFLKFSVHAWHLIQKHRNLDSHTSSEYCFVE
jgi:hypothetical protein